GLANHTVLISRQGVEIPIEDTAAPIRNTDQNTIGAIVVFHDVTRRRQAERQLVESEAKFRRIFETANEGIWILDTDGRISLVNDRMAELIGYSKDELLGRFKWDFCFPADVPDIKALFEKRRAGLPSAVDVRFCHKDGREVLTLMSARPILDQHKNFQGALDMFTDFPTRKQAETQLAHAHAQLNERADRLEAVVAERTAHLQRTIAELEGVSYSLSHDMRAPLRAIQSFTQIVLEEASDKLGPDHTEFLGKVVSAAARLDRLIQDVLLFSRISRERIESGHVEVEPLL